MPIRINESPNPSFENIATGFNAINVTTASSTTQAYSGAGTKSLKVTYSANSAVGGAGIYRTHALLASTAYTFSWWVYVPTGSAPVQAVVQSGLNVSGAASTLYDQWQRISVTFTTTTAANYDLFILNAATSTAATFYYADAVLLEKGSVLGTYFDGNTVSAGFTYDWLGYANESKSYEIAGAGGRLNRFTQPSAEGAITAWTFPMATGTASTDRAWDRTKSFKIVCNGSANAWNSGASVLNNLLTIGQVYTFSCYVWIPTGAPAFGLVATGTGMTNVHGAYSTVFDAWTRLSVTFTAAQSAGSNINLWLYNTATTPAGGCTIYMDAALLEHSGTVGTYFDGSSTTVSGYTAAWTGTADTSESYVGPGRTNYCKNPSFEVDTAGWDLGGLTRVTSQSYVGGCAGNTTSALSTSTLSVAYGFSSNLKTSSSIAVVPGEVWTISFYAKNTATASQSVGIRTLWMNSGGTWVSDTGNPLNSTVTNTAWSRVTATVTVPSGIGWMGFAPVGSAAIFMDAVLVEKAGSAGTYFDGSMFIPGEITAWSGTANNSFSTTTPGTSTQTSSAVEYIHLSAGVESAMALASLDAQSIHMNVGATTTPDPSAAESINMNVLENAGVDGGWGPAVVGVDTGAITTTANPTVTLTNTPLAGDVLLLTVFTGSNAEPITDVSGCGATWTRLAGAANYLYAFWIGTGATSAGTITTTGGALAAGKVVRVHHLRGVDPVAFVQARPNSYKMRLSNSQIAIGYGHSQTTVTGSSLTQTSKVPGGVWTDQAEIALTSHRCNSTYLMTSGALDCQIDGGLSAVMIVVGSPVAGATVMDRTMIYNGGLETASQNDWSSTNSNFTVPTDTAKFGTRAIKVTATGAAPIVYKNTTSGADLYCIAGRTYTASAYVKSVNARNARVNLRWAAMNGALSTSTNGSTTALAAGGDWVRLTATGVAPAGQYYAGIGVELTDGISGDIFYVDGCRVEEGSSASAYFDGSVVTPGRLNIDVPTATYYSVQTTVPPAPKPTVPGVYVGSITTAANPTVIVTATPLAGDVLILTDARGNSGNAEATAVTGCGATWTKIGGGNTYQSFWLGVGATSSGTVTVTALASTAGRNVRIHQLRGVSPDIYVHQPSVTFPVVATPNQIILGSGIAQTAVPAINGGDPVSSVDWVIDPETSYAAAQRHNTIYAVPKYTGTFTISASAYPTILVIGSPFAGMTVARRNLVSNPGMESGDGGWLTNGTTTTSRTMTTAATGGSSSLANYNNSATVTFYRAYGGNSNGQLGQVVPGRTYTISGWARCNSARTAAIAPQWMGAVQGLSSTGTYTTAVTLPANTWTRVSWTGVAPAGAFWIGVATQIYGAATGDQFMWDGFLIEESSTVGEYFDGTSPAPLGKVNFSYGPSDLYQSLQLLITPANRATLKQRESGAWVSHTGVSKARVGGVWVDAIGRYWTGADWGDLT